MHVSVRMGALLGAIGLGCTSSVDQPASLESETVIAEDNRTVVADDGSNVPEKYRPLLDAIGSGLVSDGDAHCTHTHIGNGVVVTAGHCITQLSMSGQPEEACANLSIQWGYRTALVPRLVSKCTAVLAVHYRLFLEGRADSRGLTAGHGRGEPEGEESLHAVVRADRIGHHETQLA